MVKFIVGMNFTNHAHCEDCNVGQLCTTEKQANLWWRLHNKKCKNPKHISYGLNITYENIKMG